MPYYQVMITKKSGKTRRVFAFDFSRKQIEDRIITPFTMLKPFMCGKWRIEPSDVEHIRINQTNEPSSKILSRTKFRRIGEKFLAQMTDIGPAAHIDELYVIHAGKDVTNELIKELGISEKMPKAFAANENVFIVHGRDTKSLTELKGLLQKLNLNPIVLIEQPSGARTTVEKLEKYADDVGYAFVILTPDDIGCLKDRYVKLFRNCLLEKGDSEDSKKQKMSFLFKQMPEYLNNRARQNVVLEFGFLIGRLGREKVCCLLKGDVERPSDMDGIVYVPFKESVNEAKDMIIKELREASYEIRTKK